jgi:SAM-dependent methyltransferase
MSSYYVNLACGRVFVAQEPWLNYDYTPVSDAVRQANLLGRLPLPDNTAALVYSSHFLEHIPRQRVPSFLHECRRILEPGGILRLVVPDLEEMCRAYLKARQSGDTAQGDFLVLEMVDQCVRRESGGELGRFYAGLCSNPAHQQGMLDYVRLRTGEDLTHPQVAERSPRASIRSIATRARARFDRLRLRYLLPLLPRAFVAQNVSRAGIGELHQWLWDYSQLERALTESGFVAVRRCDSTTSGIPDFPLQPLDLAPDGSPRKGIESMYVEAKRGA